MKFTAILIIFLSIIYGPAEAQTQPFIGKLKPFEGAWKGEGKLFGSPATFQLSFSFELNDNFLQLKFRNAYTAQNDSYAMDALAMYKMESDSTLTGKWFDSRGMMLDLTSTLKNNILTSLWSNDREQGQTVYQMINQNQLLVKDYVYRSNEWVLFGEANYRKEN